MNFLRRLSVLIATKGERRFREEEGAIQDIRKRPPVFGGYSVAYRNSHSSVRIEQAEYKKLKASFLELATSRRAKAIDEEFRGLKFEPYAPVRHQLLNIRGVTKKARREAGFEPMSVECPRMRRQNVSAFVGEREAA